MTRSLPGMAWIRSRDRGLSALRRATRTAIVMPGVFALGSVVIGNPALATFAAFGAFAQMLLVDFGGPRLDRAAAQASLGVAGAVLICPATAVSSHTWAAAAVMLVVGFVVLFSGVVSSVLAGATNALLLSFILPVALPAPASEIGDRVAGWLPLPQRWSPTSCCGRRQNTIRFGSE